MRGCIRKQLIILTLIPNIIIALLLGGYLIHMRLYDAQKYLQKEGHYILNNLTKTISTDAPLAPSISQNLTEAALSYYDVNKAAIYDAKGNVLSAKGTMPSFTSLMSVFKANQGRHNATMVPYQQERFFVRPIHRGNSEPSAYLIIGLQNATNSIFETKEIVATLFITLCALIISLVFSLKLSAQIIEPITEVTQAIEKIKRGQLNIRVKLPARGELKQLKIAMNTLIDSLRARKSPHRKVDS